MNRVIIFLAMFMPMLANAMSIKVDEIDEFSGLRTVITSWEHIDKGHTIHMRFRLQNDIQFLDFKLIKDDAIVIGEDEKLLFKSTTDSIASFHSVRMYSGGIGNGAVGLSGSKSWGISATYLGDLSWFANNITRLIRIYATDGYYDQKIDDAGGKKLVNLYNLFNQTISGEPGSVAFSNYNLIYAKRHLPKGSWEVVKEDFVENLSAEELESIKQDWEKQSTEKVIFKLQAKKEK